MNRKPLKERGLILHCLAEGNSIRATSRMIGASKNTVTKLLVEVGHACALYQNEHLVNLRCKRIQVDEIWSFVYAMQNYIPEDKYGQAEDVWTWTAICVDTKLVPSWCVGTRGAETGRIFICDVAKRMTHRIQLTSNGHKPYLEAVEGAFGDNIDFTMLVKIYGAPKKEEKPRTKRGYIGTKKVNIVGNPDVRHISTSFAEKQDLTMSVGIRRFARSTNAFSKKIENHIYAVSLHFMYYNFARIHKTLRVTPAIEAGVADHVWTLEEIAALADSN